MPEIGILEWLAYLIGAILLIGSVSTVISRWLDPFKELRKDMQDVKNFKEQSEETLNDIKASNHLVCRAVVALLEHEITGNHVETLKKCNEDIQNYLIDKS